VLTRRSDIGDVDPLQALGAGRQLVVLPYEIKQACNYTYRSNTDRADENRSPLCLESVPREHSSVTAAIARLRWRKHTVFRCAEAARLDAVSALATLTRDRFENSCIPLPLSTYFGRFRPGKI
jgi:hypothetical protein